MEHQSAMDKKIEKLSYAFRPLSQEIPYQTLPDRLQENAKTHPEREAVVFVSVSGERDSIGYRELYEQASNFAKGLLEIGIKRNDVVAISNKNCKEWLVATFGTQMAGAVPLHFVFKSSDGSDILAVLRNVPGCKMIILDSGKNDKNINICKQFLPCFNSDLAWSSASVDVLGIKKVLFLVPPEKAISHPTIFDITEAGKSSNSKFPKISADDTAGIFLTSGSTGIPKAVPHTHLSLLHFGYSIGEVMKLSSGEKFSNDRPFGWVGGYPCDFITNMTTRITASDIMAFKTIEELTDFTTKILEEEKCTAVGMMPTCIHDYLQRKVPLGINLPLNVIGTGGAPVDANCAKAALKIVPWFSVVYGATEFVSISSITVSSADEFEDYCVGYPARGVEIKVVDDHGNTVPKGNTGEIYARGRFRFQGYINNKEMSAKCCDKTGWYKTDDIGRMKNDGRLFVEGRKSDMMIIGGLLVSPLHVESILKTHPRVVDAYIFPVHDEKMFQLPCAAVVVNPMNSVTGPELTDYILQQHGGYKDSFLETRYIPENYFFFEDLPRTHNGKLDREATALKVKIFAQKKHTE